MNLRELEALVVKMQERLDAMPDVRRLEALEEVVAASRTELGAVKEALTASGVELGAVKEAVTAVAGQLEAAGGLLEELRMKVEGRNKSAASKRNMTDDDAMRVLKGDLAAMGHKDAAERVGLTYAQVYSCRLGFTFKHVIHVLEKDGWRSPWAKG
jgi:hypothetical protein